MLTPTRIYVKSCLAAIRQTKAVKGLAHITGGGFPDNIPRVLPKGLGARIDLARVPVQPVFKWLADEGGIAPAEMLRTFNCGIGMIAVAAEKDADKVTAAFTAAGESAVMLGKVVRASGEPRVTYDGKLDLWSGSKPMSRKRVAVLISGRGSNMAALIEAAKDKTYPAEIVRGRFQPAGRRWACMSRAPPASPPRSSITPNSAKTAPPSSARCKACCEQHRIEIVCLAGFMRLLTPWFVDHWPERMLNIHPALLPAFKGLDTHRRALEAGAKVHGATVHFVVPEMDSGPIIVQGAVAVRADDSEETLAKRVLGVEHRIYPLALKLVAEGRVRVVDGRCLIDGVPVPDSPAVPSG